MKKLQICILGGTGFVGRHLVNRLTADGHRLRVLTRRRERHRPLTVNPLVTLIEADIHDEASLQRHFLNADVIINLVGILNQSSRDHGSFRNIHVDLSRKVIQAATQTGASRLLHMSALNASPDEDKSLYLRTKGEAEDLVHSAEGLAVTSFRPSVIFGADDSFFNRFATLLKLSPLFFPLACPDSRFAPVYVVDVAEAFARSLADDGTIGRRLELCGPEIFTLKELVEYTGKLTGRKCMITGLSPSLSRFQARVFQHLPGRPFTMDNYHSLQKDSVCRHSCLEDMGIHPASIASIIPASLGSDSRHHRYARFRRHSRRS